MSKLKNEYYIEEISTNAINKNPDFIKAKLMEFAPLFCNFIKSMNDDKYNIKTTFDSKINSFFEKVNNLKTQNYDLSNINTLLFPDNNNKDEHIYDILNFIINDNKTMFHLLKYFKEVDINPILEDENFIMDFNIKMDQLECNLKLNIENKNTLYNQITNNLVTNLQHIFFNIGNQYKTKQNEDKNKKYDYCYIYTKNIPTDGHIYLGITVNYNDIHIYKNGQLISTCILKNISETSTKPFTFFPDGGFNGKLGPFYYYDNPLNSETMYNEYENIVYTNPKIITIT